MNQEQGGDGMKQHTVRYDRKKRTPTHGESQTNLVVKLHMATGDRQAAQYRNCIPPFLHSGIKHSKLSLCWVAEEMTKKAV